MSAEAPRGGTKSVTVDITAQIQGHPWDLWGLAQLFNGENELGLRVVAEKPPGEPRIDFTKHYEIERFRRTGYDIVAQMTADVLRREHAGTCNLPEAADQAKQLLASMNGTAKLLDPGYYGVRLISLSFKSKESEGGHIPESRTPNKGRTGLGRVPEHAVFGPAVIALGANDRAIRFVLDAFSLPVTWASLYLIYDCIASTIGGTTALQKKGWISREKLRAFAQAANISRDIRAGIRHGFLVSNEETQSLVPLHEGHDTVMRLTYAWLEERITSAET
jgi:hypothetical protein